MSADAILKEIDTNKNQDDHSPARKRPKYNSFTKADREPHEKWSLYTKGVLLNEFNDCGVGPLLDSKSDASINKEKCNPQVELSPYDESSPFECNSDSFVSEEKCNARNRSATKSCGSCLLLDCCAHSVVKEAKKYNPALWSSDYDSDAFVNEEQYEVENQPATCSRKALPNTEYEQQIAYLKSMLSKETLHKIAAGEWDSLLKAKNIKANLKINYFQMLSDEVVLNIFHWLPKQTLCNASLVCHRWHRLTQDDSLWTRMDIGNRFLYPGALGHMLDRQAIILRLTQSEISFPPIFSNMRAYRTDFKARLMYLDLSMASISEVSLEMLFSKCNRLKKVSLEHVPVNKNVMRALSYNKGLQVLNLAMVEGLDEDGIIHLLSNCCKLKELNMAWTYLDFHCISYLCSHLPSTVERLNLSGCRKHLTNNHVLNLVTCCPGLIELDLSDSTGLSGKCVCHIAHLHKLNFLALSRCYNIVYQALFELKNIHSLSHLDIHGGFIKETELTTLQSTLGPKVQINKFMFSSVARPTVGVRRSSMWGMRVRD